MMTRLDKTWQFTIICVLLIFLTGLVTFGLIYRSRVNLAAQGNGVPPLPPGASSGNGMPPQPPGGMGAPPQGGMGPGVPGGPGGQSQPNTSGVYEKDSGKSNLSKRTLHSKRSGVSAIKASGSAVINVKGTKITKTGGTTSTEGSDFFGLNAGVLAESGGKVNLSNCTITTDAEGANAVFATGRRAAITLSNVKIVTKGKGSSRGLDGTLGGTITAKNVDITTSGEHCAAVATDRGGATINVTGGTMRTSGAGSPGIYSTGNITAVGSKMTAYNSEAAVIEGKNSITLKDSDLVGKKGWGVMLYQSFSGDAEVGTSVFTATGGSLTAQIGPLFYTTNTQTKINLKGVNLKFNSGTFLQASTGRWGNSGSNGAAVTLNASNQLMPGDIICDSISSIDAVLSSGSTLRGAVDSSNTGRVNLTLDKTSKWVVTGDSHLTDLVDKDQALKNITSNGYNVYYDRSSKANSWLGRKSYRLPGGGKLIPR